MRIGTTTLLGMTVSKLNMAYTKEPSYNITTLEACGEKLNTLRKRFQSQIVTNVGALGEELKAQSFKSIQPTTTVIALFVLGTYPTCALASTTYTSVVAEGGVQGIIIVMYRCISMSKRSVHVCPTKGVRTYVSCEQEPMHSGAFGSRTILSQLTKFA